MTKPKAQRLAVAYLSTLARLAVSFQRKEREKSLSSTIEAPWPHLYKEPEQDGQDTRSSESTDVKDRGKGSLRYCEAVLFPEAKSRSLGYRGKLVVFEPLLRTRVSIANLYAIVSTTRALTTAAIADPWKCSPSSPSSPSPTDASPASAGSRHSLDSAC